MQVITSNKKLDDIDIHAIGNTIQLVGAIYAGEGMSLLCYFPGDDEDLSIHKLEMDIDDWTKFIKQTDIMEVKMFSDARNPKLVKAITRKSLRQIDQRISWKVYKRDGYRCRYCGKDDMPLTVDHLVLWEEGGPSIEDNLVSSCRKCNKIRGNIPYEDWLKHPYYATVSINLSKEVKQLNENISHTLDNIPMVNNIRSRRKKK